MRSIAPNFVALSGDSTLYVEKVNWSSWTTTEAIGSGVLQAHDCRPDCAGGRPFFYPVAIHLVKPVMTSCGSKAWGLNEFVFTGSVPAPGLTGLVHRNGHTELDRTPELEYVRC